MKLVRYGNKGSERPGIIDADGRIRALWPAITDLTPDVLTPEGLAVLRAIDPQRLPVVEGNPRLGAPVAGPRQFIALGRNYALHVKEAQNALKEAKNALPEAPMVFNKALTSISGACDDIPLYPDSHALDYEGELAVIIAKRAHRIDESVALEHVAGYCISNDVSERDWQFKHGGLIGKGKSAPGYGPLGPWLVTTDEIPDPQQLRIRTWVNDELRQDGQTSDMLFPVAYFISHVSQFMELLPGDVLITGTPDGVGGAMEPPMWLKDGDRVEIEISGLGRQRQSVRAQRT